MKHWHIYLSRRSWKIVVPLLNSMELCFTWCWTFSCALMRRSSWVTADEIIARLFRNVLCNVKKRKHKMQLEHLVERVCNCMYVCIYIYAYIYMYKHIQKMSISKAYRIISGNCSYNIYWTWWSLVDIRPQLISYSMAYHQCGWLISILC